ncbi:MAG: Fe2+-dependent dioxygenase [Betaproteobacteria bacterium]|nr:MAG: Fe2+-dependent dioxygenase [Betaproteobacteria bacterium]
MLITLESVLNPKELQRCQTLLHAASWSGGEITAGKQSALAKNNQQLDEQSPQLGELRAIVMTALSRHAIFFSAALPKQVFPPLFNRYSGSTNSFGAHVDGAMRPLPDGRGYLRTDLSATLFLSEPASYDGGELIVADAMGERSVKLAAGSMVLYSATTVHRVAPVTRGERLACFTWLQSMVPDDGQRHLLFEMDMALLALRQRLGDHDSAVVALTGTYHNLLRRWGAV